MVACLRVRRRRIEWTVALAVLCTFLTSGAASAAPPEGDGWLREQVLAPRDLPGFGVAGDSSVPLDDLFIATGAFVSTIREGAVRAAHDRALDSFDGTWEVDIRLVEMVNHEFAAGYRNPGQAVVVQPALIAPAAKVVQRPTTSGSIKLYTAFARGRVKAEVVTIVNGATGAPATLRAAAELIRRAADAQYRALADSPDVTAGTTISLAPERAALITSLVTSILLFLALATV